MFAATLDGLFVLNESKLGIIPSFSAACFCPFFNVLTAYPKDVFAGQNDFVCRSVVLYFPLSVKGYLN
jgi:hypothetical protein